MKKINLTNKHIVLVDNIDFTYVNKYCWQYQISKRNKKGYAYTSSGKKFITMHQLIAIRSGLKIYPTIDHINGNTLDNRRNNLRTATRSEQIMNTGLRSNNKSGYKGVFYNKRYKTKPWIAKISKNGKRIERAFKTLKEAVIAYNKMAKKLYGDFAWLNSLP